jgi:hypothetical protein
LIDLVSGWLNITLDHFKKVVFSYICHLPACIAKTERRCHYSIILFELP